MNGLDGFFSDSLVDKDFGRLVAQAKEELFHCVEAHEAALVAGAGTVVGWRWDKNLFRASFAHFVDDTAFGCNDKY